MKKLTALVLCLVLALAGCAKEAPQTGAVGVVNPMSASSAEEILEKDGITMVLPEGAENLRWSRIVTGEQAIAQVQFDLNGNALCFRGMKTAVPEDISGMYYEWGEPEGGEVPAEAPRCFVNETGQGILLWYADGCSFSLSMSENASADLLTAAHAGITGK